MNTKPKKPVYLVNLDKMAVVGRFASMDDLMVVADAAKYNYTEFDCTEDLEGDSFKFADMMALYNNIAETPIKKFRDKATGAARVMALVEEHNFAPIKPRAHRGEDAVLVLPEAEKKPYREDTKVGVLIDALKEGGFTLEELAEKVGWKTDTVTAYFYYDVKRKGYGVERRDGKFYIAE